jgi:hypothetical protein
MCLNKKIEIQTYYSSLFILIIKVIIMNTIKQNISKRFVKKYCSKVESKVEPDNQFIEKCVGVWSLWIICCAIGGGTYGAYKGYECKRLDKNNNDTVANSCARGCVDGGVVGLFGPCIVIGCLASAIKSKME